jgi:hypothetical protein
MEAGDWVNAIPFAQAFHDLVHLTLLILQAFARIDIGNMDDGFKNLSVNKI